MRSKRAIVFANGEYYPKLASSVLATADDYLVCVDGGVKHCLRSGFSPDLLVGDLDSLDDESSNKIKTLGTECVRYPAEKDASDLELTFELLQDRSIEDVVLLGASGGRTDHLLFNWQLAGSRVWPFHLRVVDGSVDARVVDNTRALSITVPPGQLFSVIPVTAPASGVSVIGAQYPLEKATLALGSTIGLSNVAVETRLQVLVEEGIVFVMLVYPEQ